jgi:hypothetical protein
MAQSPDPARVHTVTLNAKSTELAPKAAAAFGGRLTLNAWLLCFDDLAIPVEYPATFTFAVYPGPGFDLSRVITVTAAATELQDQNQPILSPAPFFTPYLRYEQPWQAGEFPPGQAIELVCTIEGQPYSLNVGFMVTLGSQPPPSGRAPAFVPARWRLRPRTRAANTPAVDRYVPWSSAVCRW